MCRKVRQVVKWHMLEKLIIECLYFTRCFVAPVVFRGTSRCYLLNAKIEVSVSVRILYYNKQEYVIINSNKYRTWFFILWNINIVRMFLSLLFVYMIQNSSLLNTVRVVVFECTRLTLSLDLLDFLNIYLINFHIQCVLMSLDIQYPVEIVNNFKDLAWAYFRLND